MSLSRFRVWDKVNFDIFVMLHFMDSCFSVLYRKLWLQIMIVIDTLKGKEIIVIGKIYFTTWIDIYNFYFRISLQKAFAVIHIFLLRNK